MLLNMKTVLSLAFVLLVSFAKAQDSLRVCLPVTLQMGDWAYIASKAQGEQNDRLMDSLTIRLKPVMTLTTNVKIDSVSIESQLDLYNQLKYDVFAGAVVNRFGTALRATNSLYVKNRLDAIDNQQQDVYIQTRTFWVNRFRRIRNN